MNQIGVYAFLIVAVICVFTFVSIASWADARRKERAAYYRSETIKKIAEAQGGGGPAAIEYLREEDRIARRREREGQKLGGLITMGVGIGLTVFLGAVVNQSGRGVMWLGLIPFLTGVALLIYSYRLAPKDDVSKNAPADR